jgi:exodeoxyribonuclease VII large subunit
VQFYSVQQVTSYIQELVASDLNLSNIWIEGEVSNLKRAGSGHVYFSLKDNDAQLRCALFASRNRGYDFDQGEQVLCQGYLEFYPPRGELTFSVAFVQPAGVGRLGAEFERLKAQLEEEGLFDVARKRPLPAYPKRIAVITSPDGAAWQDIQRVLTRRWPLVEFTLIPTAVQGPAALAGLTAALESLQAETGFDLAILARGGGSIEDLWTFNEEAVARAVFRSPIPVVTGIGHESDTTIADYVADLRGSTPSVAAELSVPDRQEVQDYVAGLARAAESAHARRHRSLADEVSRQAVRLNRALPSTAAIGSHLARLIRGVELCTTRALADYRSWSDSLDRRCRALSPQATLERGYAVVQSDGRALRSPKGVTTGQSLSIRLAEGDLEAVAGKGALVRRRRRKPLAPGAQSMLPLEAHD